MRTHVGFLAFLFGVLPQITVFAQSQLFVPLKFQYPDTLLSTPKTYVYKNTVTNALRYKDVAFEKKENNAIVHWKDYDNSSLVDTCTEINGKSADHYMIINGQAIKATITEDTILQDGTRLGEKVQTRFFNLNSSISLFESVRSFFLKDTTINWQEKAVPCLVIQSYYRQQLSNSLFPDKPKEITGVIYYYYGNDVGLLMYRSEMGNEKSTWQLVEIKDKKIE